MVRTIGLSFGIAAIVLTCGSATQGQPRDAASVLAAARAALGGESALTTVKSFVATGRTRQLRGNNLVPIEFEINCELPDKYVREDQFPAQDTDVTVSGFRGEELIVFPPPAAGRGGPPPAQRLMTVKQDFARLMLGVFASSFPSYPLTFTYAAEGEAPEGKADILAVAGPAPFSARLVIQRDTHLPVMLIFQAPGPPAGRAGPPGGRGGPPPPGAQAAGPPPGAEPGPERRQPVRRRRPGCISPITAPWATSSGRFASAAAPPAPRSKKRHSTRSGST